MLRGAFAASYRLHYRQDRLATMSCQSAHGHLSKRHASASSNHAGVAVIGGGLSGAACSNTLADLKIDCAIFDMGFRGPGGRASTRTYGKLQFDHGCQFILPAAATKSLVQELTAAGACQPWQGKVGILDASGQYTSGETARDALRAAGFCGLGSSREALHVGTPGMSAVCNHLSSKPGITSYWRHKVTGVTRSDDGTWRINACKKMPGDTPDEDVSYGGFHTLVLADKLLTKPGSPCCIDLGAAEASEVVTRLQAVQTQPTITLMVAYPADSSISHLPFDGAALQGSDAIKWISNDSSKPGRPHGKHVCLSVLSTPAWAETALASEDELEKVTSPAMGSDSPSQIPKYALSLLDELQGVLKGVLQKDVPQPVFVEAQRWGSAFKADALDDACLVDAKLNLVACGDFCGQSSAEGALRSGLSAAAAVRELLSKER